MTTEQQLPEGWKIERLGDIAISEKGKKPKNQSSKKTDKFCYPYVDIEAFEKGIIKSYTDGAKCVLCDENDFLMVWDGARSGLVGKGIKGALGSTLVRISLPNINNLYAYYFLLSKYKEINTRAKGSGTPHVDPDLLWNYAFPIPPNQETQQAIVNKIESLFDEIDEGIGRLKTAVQQIQQYRQSLLKNAFNGELTKEWRSKHADALPSENELLAQIQTAREQHHAQQLADWQTAVSQWEQNGKEGKKPSKPKALTQAVKFEENFADLPSGWGVVKLDKIVKYITDGDHQAPPKSSNGIPFITISNIDKKDFSINFFDTFFVNDDYYNQISELRKPKKGDILYTVTGSFGIPVMVNFDKKFCFQRHIGLISPLEKISNQRWLFYVLQSPDVFKQAEQLSTGTAQKTVALSSLRNFDIPYCSLAEQNQIVAILESKLTACDQLTAKLAKQLKQAELLKQAVLKAAFSGSLLDK